MRQHDIDLARALFEILREELGKLARRAKLEPSEQIALDFGHVRQHLRDALDYLLTTPGGDPDERQRELDNRIVEKLRKYAGLQIQKPEDGDGQVRS